MIDPIDVPLPHLPSSLEGLRIVHLSDLHIRRTRRHHRQIAARLELMRVDLAFFTGDYIDQVGDEPASLAVMRQICDSLKPRLGSYGVFGNHDTPETRQLFRQLPVHWLNDACDWPGGVPLQIAGFATGILRRPDVVTTLFGMNRDRDRDDDGKASERVERHPKTIRFLLSHMPMYLPAASDLGIDVMFCGHTHGGQCCLPGRRALCNSSDLPMHLTSGLLRHRDTLCLVSRGLGETILPIRLCCPRHLPVYTLHRGPLPGRRTDHMINVRPW